MEENYVISEEKALSVIKNNYGEAEEILENEDKFERFLFRLEEKLKAIPKVGNKLSEVPMLISLVKQFVAKEYTDIPIGTILAIVGALLYLISHFDMIPDSVPFAGFFDDIIVLLVCIKFVESDLQEYNSWREANGYEPFDFKPEEIKIKLDILNI